MIFSLNGSDWMLTGWWKNQWRFIARDVGIKIDVVPAVGTVSATVPGAVQADLIKAGVLTDPNYGLDSTAGEWVNNREWFYDKEFTVPAELEGYKYFLHFEGLDHHGEIYFNGEKLSAFNGMFLPVEIDITGKLKKQCSNFLRVVFYAGPEVEGQYGYSSRIRTLKSRFNYVWDWCPRIVPVGIWEGVYIKATRGLKIQDFFPKSSLDLEKGWGSIDAGSHVNVNRPGKYRFVYTVHYEEKQILEKSFVEELCAADMEIRHSMDVGAVDLWWANNTGSQPLYKVALVITEEGEAECDSISKMVGFRTLEFVQNENAPAGALPYTLMLNGKRVFLRGVDWVPLSPFYGIVSREDYRNYLKRFKDMNCNILRIWGGAILEKQDFYDACDEMGLMVWQEFPQSSSGLDNNPPDNPDFLKELEKVATVFIEKRRHHVCHILWCGGNELMWEDLVPVTIHHPNMKMLNERVEQLDTGKTFLPSSASGPVFIAKEEDFGKGIHHDVHGPWNYTGDPDHYRFFNGDDSLFRSETGCPGITRLETLEKYQAKFKLWPPDRSNPYWSHRGSWWIQKKQLTQWFGEWKDDGSEIAAYVKVSRFLQAEALRYAIEATRRREPESSGFIIWMGNEPFPNNANTSVIEYDGTPKPAYDWVRNAFAPLHVSVRHQGIACAPGDAFSCEVHVTCDMGFERTVIVEARVQDMKGNILHETQWNMAAEHPAIKVGQMDWMVSQCEGDIFFVRVLCKEGEEALDENTYIFTTNQEHPFRPLRNLPDSSVQVEKITGSQPETWMLTNISANAAVGLFLLGKNPSEFLHICPCYLILLPGESRQIQVEGGNVGDSGEIPFTMEALNVR